MSATTFQQSVLLLDSTGSSSTVPDGYYSCNICRYDDGISVLKANLYFVDGVSTLDLDSYTGTKTITYVLDSMTWPPTNGALIAAVTTGAAQCYANETLRVPQGFFDYVTVDFNFGGSKNCSVLPSGACVTIDTNGELHYNTNGAFDYLEPDESAYDTISFTTEEPTNSDDEWPSVAYSYSGTTWDDTDATFFEKVITGSSNSLDYLFPVDYWDEAKEYTITFTGYIDPSAAGQKFELVWLDASNVQIGGTVKSMTQTVLGDFATTTTPPAGARHLRFKPASSSLGFISKVATITRVIDAPIQTVPIKVLASEQVGAKLVAPNGFSGTNWTQGVVDTEYTAIDSDVNKLTANLTMTAGKVYQISLSVKSNGVDALAGSVVPSIVGDTTWQSTEYSLSTEDRDVWVLYAPENVTAFELVQTSDFNGIVYDIYIREVLLTGTAASIDLDLGPDGAIRTKGLAGQIELMWHPECVSGRLSQFFTPQYYGTGTLSYAPDPQYGFRITEENNTVTYVVENANSTANRSAISTKGGEICEAYNVLVTGGYTGTSEKFQTGIVTSDNFPVMLTTQISGMYVDLIQEPMQDNYVTQNSDAFLFNSDYTFPTYRAMVYMYNNKAINIADGCIDNKLVVFNNYFTFDGGHRGYRSHKSAHALLANGLIYQQLDTEAAIHLDVYSERCLLWNTYIDDKRILSSDQMRYDVKTVGKYAGSGMFESNSDIWRMVFALEVLKTWPRIPDQCRINATGYEFEISPTGAGTWAALPVDNVELENMRGCLQRFIDYAAGTYDIRGRSRYVDTYSAWSDVVTVTVT